MPSPSDRLNPPADSSIPAAPSPAAAERTPPALARLGDLLAAAAPSMDAVRDAAVRYGGAARAAALAPDEMAAALRTLLRRSLDGHPGPVRAELEASVPWWAIHGYHRAD